MPSTPASRLVASHAPVSSADPTTTTTTAFDPDEAADTHAFADSPADSPARPDDSPDTTEDATDYPSVDEVFPLTSGPSDPSAAALTDVCGVSPEGTIQRGAVEIVQSLADAAMPERPKALALHLLVAIYAHQPKRWPASAPPPGAYHVQVRQMARDLDESPGNVSTRLKQLIDWRVLGRGAGKFVNVVWFRPVGEWDEALFDRAAARTRHRRLGAGAPARERAPQSNVPVAARRDGDSYHRPFTPRELIVEALGVARLDRLDAVWAVVEHFQRTFDESFRVHWLPQLLTLLDAGHTPTAIIATASEIKHDALARNKPGPYRPWGYLTRCLANAPTADVTPTSSEKGTSPYANPPTHATNAPTVYRADVAAAAPIDTPLARAQARSRARYAGQGASRRTTDNDRDHDDVS